MVVTIGSVLVNIAEDVLGVVANTSVLVSLSGIAGNELEVVTIASGLVCIAWRSVQVVEHTYILMFMHTLDHVIHTSIACTTE